MLEMDGVRVAVSVGELGNGAIKGGGRIGML